METLADRLIEARERRGWSQLQLGNALEPKYTQQAIGRIETGITRRPGRIVEIAKALGCNVDWLLTGEGEPDWRHPDARIRRAAMNGDPQTWPEIKRPLEDVLKAFRAAVSQLPVSEEAKASSLKVFVDAAGFQGDAPSRKPASSARAKDTRRRRQ